MESVMLHPVRTECCRPPKGSDPCFDCPLTVPDYAVLEWHDDKDDRAGLHTPTQPGDLDLAGRPMRQGD
jgi:hypothetical protein